MHVTAHLASDERQRHRLGFYGLVMGLAAGGVTLLAIAGPPHLPSALPDRAALITVLSGSYLPPEAVVYVVITVAWMLWTWLSLSVALRLMLLGAEAVARGAAWVRALRIVSDHVTLPIVRRMVDGAVVTVLVVNLMARSATASAAPLPSTAVVAYDAGGELPDGTPGPSAQQSDGGTVRYTVQPGDTLWTIAERFYGTGFDYQKLVEANAGQTMPDGSRFTLTGVIQPGWTIAVPLPSRAIDEVDGRVYYVVEDEDTLRGVAARLLGDEDAWRQIYDANRESATLPHGRVLTKPDLIWPGLRLAVPIYTNNGSVSAPPAAPSANADVPPVAEPAPASPAGTVAPASPTVVTPEPTAQPTVDPTAEPTISPSATPAEIVGPNPPEPTAVATQAPADAPTEPVVIEPNVPSWDTSSPVPGYVGAGLGALAALGTAALLLVRRTRRQLSVWPTSVSTDQDPIEPEEFAEAEPARVLEHRLLDDEVEAAVIVANQATRFFDEHDLDPVTVVMAGQRRTSVALTLNTGLASQRRLLELAPELGAHLGGEGRAWRTADHDVLLQLSDLRLAGSRVPVANQPEPRPLLLPIGVLPGRETLYVNWRELGHVLVAGLPGGGVEVVLTSLIGALTARCRPDQVRLVTIASRRTLPSQVFGLPHQSRVSIDGTDQGVVTVILEDLRGELDRRMQPVRHSDASALIDQAGRPEIVVVIGELDDFVGDSTTLEHLGVHGPTHGIRLLAASTRPDALGDDLLSHFSTRLALQALDEDMSIRLIGRRDAADLSGGELCLRLDGRAPLRARGFRLSLEHLDRLVSVMRDAYGGQSFDRPVTKAVPAEEASSHQSATPSFRAPIRRENRVDQSDSPSFEDPALEEGGSGPDRRLPASADLAERAPELNVTQISSVATTPALPPNGSEITGADHEPGTPPIQVRCFGTFRVSCGDRELSPVGSVGTHYKAWEVLAFLCVQPGGVVSREKLTSAVWPDVEPHQAASRLKVTLARLRSILNEQVPGVRGKLVRVERSGTCRLDATAISSDVQRFVALRRSAPRMQPSEAAKLYEDARAVYRDDLLVEPFYEWVHARSDDGLTLREQYREEYRLLTQRLAEVYRQAGQPGRAVPLYRDLLKADPTLEGVARSLYRCYGELGDRSALVREHHRLREAMRHSLSSPDDPEDEPDFYEPEAETVAVYEKVLADLESRSAVARPAS